MKNTFIGLLMAVFFAIAPFADAQNNASSYWRKIASEQRKIRTKQLMYYKTALATTDAKRLDKNREMILTQVKSSQQNMLRTPAFQGDSAVKNDYIRILDIYTIAYTTGYAQVVANQELMTKDASAFRQYQESVAILEGMIDEAEDKFERNETYFTNKYNVSPTEDPTYAQLFAVRTLSMYLQDVRNIVAEVPLLTQEIQRSLKEKKYKDIEEKRVALSKVTERALVSASRLGPYIDENDKDDDFLDAATINYLDNAKKTIDGIMAQDVMALDDAVYDGKEGKIEKASGAVNKSCEEVLKLDADFNKRMQKFISAYVKE